jgi:hypothetical protein
MVHWHSPSGRKAAGKPARKPARTPAKLVAGANLISLVSLCFGAAYIDPHFETHFETYSMQMNSKSREDEQIDSRQIDSRQIDSKSQEDSKDSKTSPEDSLRPWVHPGDPVPPHADSFPRFLHATDEEIDAWVDEKFGGVDGEGGNSGQQLRGNSKKKPAKPLTDDLPPPGAYVVTWDSQRMNQDSVGVDKGPDIVHPKNDSDPGNQLTVKVFGGVTVGLRIPKGTTVTILETVVSAKDGRQRGRVDMGELVRDGTWFHLSPWATSFSWGTVVPKNQENAVLASEAWISLHAEGDR